MRAVMMLVVLSLAAEPAHSQARGDPLRPLTKCTVSLSIVSGPDIGLADTDRIRAAVELRLRSLGIRVMTDEEVAKDAASIPAFEIRATAIALTSHAGVRIGTAFYLDLSLIEWTTLSRTHAMVPAVLWSEGHIQTTGIDDQRDVLERAVNNQLDSFARALLKANPPQKP
jgi:hypothetical protein